MGIIGFGSKSDTGVMGIAKAIGIGRRNASIPTKCMAQMPEPIATAPPRIQANRERPAASVTRPARLSAEYDATLATSIDTRTSGVS